MVLSIKNILLNSYTDLKLVDRLSVEIENECYLYANNNLDKYNMTCFNVLSHIDPVASYFNENLLKMILNGEIKIVVRMSPVELNPAISADLRDKVKKRIESGINKKFIDKACKFCKEMRVTSMEIQMRSLDEPKTTCYECHACGREWR